MSYSNSFPQQRPTLNLDFANSGRLDSRLSYTRSSTGTYLSSEKALSSENLLTYSNPNDAAWIEGGSTVTTDQTTSPDGTSNASALTEDSSTGVHRTLLSTPVNSGEELTIVTFLKANGRSIVQLGQTGTYGAGIWVEFDLSGSGTATTRFGSPTNVSIAQVGSTGWYKISYSSSTTSSGTHYTQLRLCDAADSVSYTGDGSSGIYAYGLNLSTTGQLTTDSTSGQRHRSYSPLLKTASANEPRFEFATDGQSVGLLIEAQETNLQRYGSAFASWSTKLGSGLTANAGIAPNGELAATLWTATSSSNYHYLNDSFASVTSGTTYTASVYVKDAGQRYVQILGGASAFGAGQYATFDLQTGSVDATGVTASSVSVGNGWWRIQATMTATGTGTSIGSLALVESATASRLPTFTADDYSGVLLFGYQFEANSEASSLVNTGSQNSALTRASDSCSVDLSDINFVGGEVTLVADTNTSAIDGYRQAASLIDDSQNQVTLYGNSYNNRLAAILGGGESSTLSQTSANGISALSFGVNDIAATRNGASPVTDTSQAFPNVSAGNLKIGGSGSSQILNGTIKRIALYNVALSDTELQAITS